MFEMHAGKEPLFRDCEATQLFSALGTDHNCCIFDKLYPSFFFFFRNGIKPVTQWAPAGCMGGDFEAINGDSKGKHSAKCQPWWLRCHNIISGRQTQITKINNLIISYSNHAVWRPGSYCSFISLVCWCIPITASRAGGCIENTVIQKNGRWTTTVTAYLHSVIDFWRFIVSRIWCRHACKMPYFIRRKCCFI